LKNNNRAFVTRKQCKFSVTSWYTPNKSSYIDNEDDDVKDIDDEIGCDGGSSNEYNVNDVDEVFNNNNVDVVWIYIAFESTCPLECMSLIRTDF
jgi:hypothetical protein